MCVCVCVHVLFYVGASSWLAIGRKRGKQTQQINRSTALRFWLSSVHQPRAPHHLCQENDVHTSPALWTGGLDADQARGVLDNVCSKDKTPDG